MLLNFAHYLSYIVVIFYESGEGVKAVKAFGGANLTCHLYRQIKNRRFFEV